MTRTVVLGAGFGGLTLATELPRLAPPGHEVVLVEEKPTFLMGLAKLWMLDGREARAAHERPVRAVERHGARVVQARATRVDPARKEVHLAADERLPYDQLVLALGARLDASGTAGLQEAALNLYAPDGVEALHRELAALDGDAPEVLFLVESLPFKCPPAPYEAAMLAKAFLARRGVDARVTVASPEPHPIPAGGPECGATVREWLEERGVEVASGAQVARVDARARVAHFSDGSSRRYDVLAAVPAHKPPAVVADLFGGFAPADAATLATPLPDVWAVGDCNVVKLANGKPLVKAGIMAEGEARVVAANVAARLRGEAPAARFDGHGLCFLELGGGEAVEIAGDFYAQPDPVVAARGLPSRAALARKHAFESERLAAWFGR